MTRPGSVVSLLDTPSSVSIPTDTGTLFITGLTDRGPVTPLLVQSITDFVNKYGDRQTYSSLYDYLETFFREGGSRAYVERIVGASATKGVRNLLDTDSAVSLITTAIGPGAWSANYKIVVYVSGSTFGIKVTDTNGVVLEDSGYLDSQASAVTWSQGSNYIRITLGATALLPIAMSATAMSAGGDDRSSIVDADWVTGQNYFTADLGPGQIAQCGRTSSTAHTQLTDHATLYSRVALLDLTDSVTVGTLTGALPASHLRNAAPWVPWAKIPALSGAAGSYRTVQMSAGIAGIIARNDPIIGVNSTSAGKNGIFRYINGLSQPGWTDDQRQTLNTAGVNVVRSMLGGIRVYGWRSLADPVNDQMWLNFGNARLYMALSAELSLVAEGYMFEDINTENIGGFNAALSGVMMFHFNNGDLYGDTAEESFTVDTGPTVNTAATAAALEMHGVVNVKMGVFAEYIPIQIVKRQITDVIAA